MTATVPSFAPTAEAFLSAGPVSSNILIPTTGTPTIISVTNTGEMVAYVAMGTSSAVSATFGSGVAIEPGKTEWLTIGANTYLAGITAFRQVGLSVVAGN